MSYIGGWYDLSRSYHEFIESELCIGEGGLDWYSSGLHGGEFAEGLLEERGDDKRAELMSWSRRYSVQSWLGVKERLSVCSSSSMNLAVDGRSLANSISNKSSLSRISIVSSCGSHVISDSQLKLLSLLFLLFAPFCLHLPSGWRVGVSVLASECASMTGGATNFEMEYIGLVTLLIRLCSDFWIGPFSLTLL